MCSLGSFDVLVSINSFAGVLVCTPADWLYIYIIIYWSVGIVILNPVPVPVIETYMCGCA